MSYDIEIFDRNVCDKCGASIESKWFNITYNIRPLLDYVGTTFQDLEALPYDELQPRMCDLLDDLKRPENKSSLVQLEPRNGWGSLGLLIECVALMLKAVEEMNMPGMRVS